MLCTAPAERRPYAALLACAASVWGRAPDLPRLSPLCGAGRLLRPDARHSTPRTKAPLPCLSDCPSGGIFASRPCCARRRLCLKRSSSPSCSCVASWALQQQGWHASSGSAISLPNGGAGSTAKTWPGRWKPLILPSSVSDNAVYAFLLSLACNVSLLLVEWWVWHLHAQPPPDRESRVTQALTPVVPRSPPRRGRSPRGARVPR